MAFNGTGTFVRIYNWVTDKTNSIPITASRMDAEIDGMATGLSNCITKDGQTTISANIPFNSKKITGLAVGSARTDSINVGQVQDGQFTYLGTTGGSADAYTLSPNPSITAYVVPMHFWAKVAATNATTTPYLQISAIGTPASDAVIKKLAADKSEIAVVAGDMVANGLYEFQRNSGNTAWILLNPSSLPLLSGSAIALTIATGVVTLTNNSSSYVLDTEGAAATDDLDTINGGQDGQIIYLRIANNARNVIVKHNTGNIFNPQYNNNHSLSLDRAIFLDNTTDFVVLRYDLTIAKWIICSSSFDNFVNYKAATGYTYLPNGLIMQWGEEASFHDIASDYTATITFQIAFPNSVLQAVVGYKGASASIQNNDPTATYTNLSTTGFTLNMGEFAAGTNSVKGVYWAIGW